MPKPGDPRPDSRQHPRYDAEIRVDWTTGRMFVSDKIGNISEGGLFLRSAGGLGPDTEVDMVLWLPGRAPIRATGHVVWSLEAPVPPSGVTPGGGLRFTSMHSADRAMLRAYLDEVATGAERERGH